MIAKDTADIFRFFTYVCMVGHVIRFICFSLVGKVGTMNFFWPISLMSINASMIYGNMITIKRSCKVVP